MNITTDTDLWSSFVLNEETSFPQQFNGDSVDVCADAWNVHGACEKRHQVARALVAAALPRCQGCRSDELTPLQQFARRIDVSERHLSRVAAAGRLLQDIDVAKSFAQPKVSFTHLTMLLEYLPCGPQILGPIRCYVVS
jgi:hypothetical protein